MKRILIVVPVLLLCMSSVAAAQSVLTQCGQTVANAVLISDLDCTGTQSYAVVVNDGGTLNLAGNTLTGGTWGGVWCKRNCAVVGGGGAIVAGEDPDDRFFSSGVAMAGRKIGHERVVVRGVLDISGTRLSGHDSGTLEGRRIHIRDCVISDNRGAFSGQYATVADSVISSNMNAGQVQRNLAVTGTTVTDNYVGLRGRHVEMSDTVITGSGRVGVMALRRLRATGSVIESSCGHQYGVCADVMSARRPRMTATSCGASLRFRPLRYENSTEPWGVCEQD